MLSYKLNFSCCAIRDGFRRDSHNYVVAIVIRYCGIVITFVVIM